MTPQPIRRSFLQERPTMDKESVYLLMLAAGRYAGSRSEQDRAVMLSVGNDFWKGFPAFLAEMKTAIQEGRSRAFLRQDDVKHMYALLFVSILNGLDSAYVNKVGGALLAAASPRKAGPFKKMRGADRNTRTQAER
jgi:hypothetical protein